VFQALKPEVLVGLLWVRFSKSPAKHKTSALRTQAAIAAATGTGVEDIRFVPKQTSIPAWFAQAPLQTLRQVSVSNQKCIDL
jgi:hypothetical protein